jgi:hypothetical protein
MFQIVRVRCLACLELLLVKMNNTHEILNVVQIFEASISERD